MEFYSGATAILGRFTEGFLHGPLPDCLRTNGNHGFVQDLKLRYFETRNLVVDRLLDIDRDVIVRMQDAPVKVCVDLNPC